MRATAARALFDDGRADGGVSGEVRLGVCADVETNGVVASFGEGMPMGYSESSAQPMAKAVSRVTRVSGMPKRMKVADE